MMLERNIFFYGLKVFLFKLNVFFWVNGIGVFWSLYEDKVLIIYFRKDSSSSSGA